MTDENKQMSGQEMIIEGLQERAGAKQSIYKIVKESFEALKEQLEDSANLLSDHFNKADPNVRIAYEENGKFEARLKFSGDLLVFTMHSNVFNFPDEHHIHKNKYVMENKENAYCGMIQIHNFLADSFKYNRMQDVGYLIGRIFINKEKHFFTDGQGQFQFLFNDFANNQITKPTLKTIAEVAILYALEFDLFAPPYDLVKQITVQQKLMQDANAAFKTGKRVGFAMEYQKPVEGEGQSEEIA